MLVIPISLMFFALGAGLVWFMLKNDHGSKEPITALWTAAGFGLLSLFFAIFLSWLLLPKTEQIAAGSLSAVFVSMMGVGLVEEASKFFPLALYIYKKPYFNEYTDGIIYFGISGLVFGTVENFLYSASLGNGAGLGRMILTPFFHAAGTAIIGFFLIRFKLKKQSPLPIIGIYVLVAGLHGLYNVGLVAQMPILIVVSLMISALLTMSIFLLLMKANELDKSLGLSATGTNKFCRGCGQPNTERNLYCVSCGSKA